MRSEPMNHGVPPALVMKVRMLVRPVNRVSVPFSGVCTAPGCPGAGKPGTPASSRSSSVNDDPPGAFDPGFWWPAQAGYGRGISQMRYAPIETWQTLPDALRAVGMGSRDVDGVLGDNMARVARQVWGAATD